MAACGSNNSRKLLARKRLQKRSAARRILLESLEARQLLTVGPQLLSIQPNTGDILESGEVLNVSPKELVFRFDDGAGIDATSLGGIRIVRSGDDGVFERASRATDFNTGGQTLVEFYAREAGQAGNGIQIQFSKVNRSDTRAPVLRVTGRTIDVELNSNPTLETRVEDLLQAFSEQSSSAAGQLVYALRLRGSQTIGIANTVNTATPLILTGANAAKTATNFGLGNNLEVRLVARDGGNNGLGITISVSAVDRGGAGAPVVTVNGKAINVQLNSNPRFATTVQEFVDALNASDSFASQLVEAQLVSGVGATRIGASPITYSPLTLTGVTDIEIAPAYVGLGDSDREVIFRFAEPLPDDQYRIEILGQGIRVLKNVEGEAFNNGNSVSVRFELNLGAQVESVVPQPVSRDPVTGQLSWTRTSEIDVYLSDDPMLDLNSIQSVNGQTLSQLAAVRGTLYIQNSDTIVFSSGSGQTGVLNPQFYQLLSSQGTLTTADDPAPELPTRIRYYPDANRVSLRFPKSLDQYAAAGGELRLRIGTNESQPLAPIAVDGLTTDPADTFAGAQNLSTAWTPGAAGSQSVIIDSEIKNTTPLLLDFPGGSDEPGNRNIRIQDNLRLGADTIDGTSVIFYNFQGQLGVLNGSTLLNAITETQKTRVREVMSLYEQYLGVRFVESENLGFTIGVGDMRAIVPFPDVVGGTTPGIAETNQPGLTVYEAGTLISNGQPATVLDIQDFGDATLNQFGGPFMRASMQAVGKLLGLGDADELEQMTIQSFASVFAPGVGTEIVLPGDADIVHGQYLYRPDSKDIDLYQFSLPIAGRISIEAFAERMSSASLLDSQIRLFQETASGWEAIAANDDYFSSDSFLELDLAQGNYIVGVSASGNASYDPAIADSGIGGRSQGQYQLRMDFHPPANSVLRDGDTAVGTEFDGDADGVPGGVFDFWFRPSNAANTKFVDKASPAGGTGTIASPYKDIDDALATATPGTVVRVLGNAGADGNFATLADNKAYEIGFDNLGRPLPDGMTLDVPKGVTVMIDAGAILKLRRARVGVGSSSVSVDRSGGTLLVLGTPTLQTDAGQVLVDANGEALAGDVYFTSLNHAGLGLNANTAVVGTVPSAGDWGGIDFRTRVDAANSSRLNLEAEGIFLNWISHADIRYGGGQVVVDGLSQVVTPIQMIDARPAVINSSISRSADAAMSASPNSFLESNFHSPAEQRGTVFSVDYDRVGPELHGNRLTNNSINGLQVRVRTPSELEKLTVAGRFDDTDIVHYIPENLEIQGTPGGAVQSVQAPSSTRTTLTAQAGGTLASGTYRYRFTALDSAGNESPASEPSAALAKVGTGSIVLSNVATNVSRIYRSSSNGEGPYVLVGQLPASVGTFIDNGSDLGTLLMDSLPAVKSRQDARLVIDAGTVIKSQGARIDVHMGAQLIAEGTDGNPVVFTSLNDNRYGAGGTFDTANRVGSQTAESGDWGGVYVGHTSKASFDYSVLAYGGGTTRVEGGFADFSAVEVHQADLRLVNSRVEKNAAGADAANPSQRGGRGANSASTIFIRASQPIIVGNIISDNMGPAISANVSALNYYALEDYGRSTGASDRYEAGVGNKGPLVAQNRLDNNDINGMVVRGGALTTEGHWDDTDIVHVVLDEIRVPDYHAFGGLRLTSASNQSLVVKLAGANAGFTATGTPLDNANRIGGSVQLVGQPGFPVILTSLTDSTVGAGFKRDGNVQSDTDNISLSGLLPTGPEVDNGTLIDNDVAPGIPGQFSFDVGPAGSSNFGGQGGISAQGNTQLFTNVDVIFNFLNYVDVGGNGNAINLANSVITLAPTLIAPDLVVSEGTFNGANGAIAWRIESRMDNGIAKVFNTITLTSQTALGDLQVINYLDEDVLSVSDDILYLTGTPGEEDFRAYTLDGPERVGFNQGGIYTATPGLLENASYEGWAADRFRDLANAIETNGTTYTIAGNIDTTDLPAFVDAELGDVYGPNDITTAFAWRVNPSATSARITSFLELVPRNPAVTGTAGDWRSVLLSTNSNDRNVAVATEAESPLSNAPRANETPAASQYLGTLAPDLKSGDENKRLGFHIEAAIAAPNDVDVYTFSAQAGTEVWLDIDRTNNALDTVVELIDANGNTLALSDSSLAEEADPSLLYASTEISRSTVNPLRSSPAELYFTSALGAPKDLFSTNPKDAGLRVSLPGETGASNLYHVRVRSSNLTAGDPVSKLTDPAQVTGGLSKGNYILQIRLSEVDEIPGSSINYADIRFAQNGVDIVGLPGNSPLLGENGEVESNDVFASAQPLGNLLQTSLQALSVAGNLDSVTDVDWYSFDIDYQRIRPTSISEYFATVFDIDYANGIGRPDTSMYVFDSNGNLILGGLGSNVVDDQASPLNAADNSDLSRGSAGSLDPFIGSYELPAGTYFLAITNSSRIPEVITQFSDPTSTTPLVRLQPIDSIRLIAEDHVSFNGGSSALSPIVPDLFVGNSAIVDYTLGDLNLYVSQNGSRSTGVQSAQTRIYLVNPFTGQQAIDFDIDNGDLEDIAFRTNGELRGFTRSVLGGQAGVDPDTIVNYTSIDTGTGLFTTVGTSGLQTFHLDTTVNPAVIGNSDDGVHPEAITFGMVTGQERGFFVGNRTTPTGLTPSYFGPPQSVPNVLRARPGVDYFTNILYEFDETTGAAISGQVPDRQGVIAANGAGTAVVERGRIDTGDPTNNPAIQLVAREATNSIAGQLQFVLRDGAQFSLIDQTGLPLALNFEFDFGPEAIVSYDPISGPVIRDGMQFVVDGVTYEFDTGSIIVVSAGNGSQIADGSTVNIKNAAGQEMVFEFDSNNTLSDPNHIRVRYASTSTQEELVRALTDAINTQTGFAVRAETASGFNRISLVGASATDPVLVTGSGISVTSTPGVSASAVRIPISEFASEQQLIDAIGSAMQGDIVVGYEGGRVNFSGATIADFADLAAAGIFRDQGSSGAVRAGNIGIRALASDTAETIAARIAQAIADLGIVGLSATVNGRVLLLFGATVNNPGPLTTAGVAPGGLVTGIATIGNTLYAVSNAGGLYRIARPDLPDQGVFPASQTYVSGAFDLIGIQFTGLVAGPDPALTGGVQVLLGIDSSGRVHAFDTSGQLQPIFANGASSIATGITGANGLALAPQQSNPWGITNTNDNTNRENDAGHGTPQTSNGTRGNGIGGASYYFGNSQGTPVDYNFAGGAAGALESVPFSLAGIGEADLPTLYFNYFLNTEDGTSAGAATMVDAFRVYASGEDGNWVLLATNDSARVAGDIQELFDNTGGWRQARVPLDSLAGQDNIKLRFEFSTGGGFGYGFTGGRGPEIRTISGDRLVDGQTLTINGRRFEIEMGATLALPSGASLSNGDSFTVDGTVYVFTDGSAPVAAPAVGIPFQPSDSSEQIALAVAAAVTASTPPVVSGINFSNEENEILSEAISAGIIGNPIRVVGTGNIGDNGMLPNAGEDVDMVRFDLTAGATAKINVNASTIGSGLDSYLRVFDAQGNEIGSNDNRTGSTDSEFTFTSAAGGRYYVGVSGAGNASYNPSLAGSAAIGSTGDYELVIEVTRAISAVVAGNRVQLDGASQVQVAFGTPVLLQGTAGTSGIPIRISANMTTQQVSQAVQQSIAAYFANGNTGVYAIRGGDTIDLTGLTVNNAGPFGLTTSFVGDFSGSFNNEIRAQNNAFEGVYVDDFIIGVAGRGEMVIGDAGGNTNFVANPGGSNQILTGPYQVEIRGGEEYGIPEQSNQFPQFTLVNSFSPTTRQAPGVAIQFNHSSSMIPGDTFTVSNGPNVITFELDDVNDGRAVAADHIPLPFNTSVVDPLSGGTSAESSRTIAARFRDLLNSSAVYSQLGVAGNLLNNDRIGATSDTVVLIGNPTVVIPSSIGQKLISDGVGDQNRERPQGQVVVSNSRISNSAGFGATIAAAPRDSVTNAPIPGSPRNTVTINDERLAPGAVIMNSEFISNASGGINVTGDSATAGLPPAAVPFVRLVNNSIIGGVVSTITEFTPLIFDNQVYDIGTLAFADNVVSYDSNFGGGPAPLAGLDNPADALGIPNYSGVGEPIAGQGVVSLGRGGRITLEFRNNLLTGSGDASPDLKIFEVGDSEDVLVEVSADGVRFTSVGTASQASGAIDIDAYGFNPNSRLAYVRLTDVGIQGSQSGDSVGADIDAVGALTSVAADFYAAGGVGISVTNNATATLLNNVLINSTTGINVDSSSASTVIGGTTYQRNVANVSGSATLGQFPNVVANSVPIFVATGLGNLYPAASSPVIDSSIDSLEDRPSLVAVKTPLGLSASPILAPQTDINGQLRVDDPAVETPSGLGENVFKDRGAQDRADFVGPSVVLIDPVDNDLLGVDGNSAPAIVELTNATLHFFDIQLFDGLEPVDPNRGSGIDHRTVSAESVLLYRNNVPLVQGVDYRFGYDSTNGVIRLTPLTGVWPTESAYTIRFINSRETTITATQGSSYTDGDLIEIIDSTGLRTTFEIDLGYTIAVPTSNGIDASVTDGTTFTVDDGTRLLTFEFDNDGLVTVPNRSIALGTSPTPQSVARAIQNAVVNAALNVTVTEVGVGRLQLQGSSLARIDAQSSGLILNGTPGVRTAFGLQIPLQAGTATGLTDGQTFSIDRNGTPVVFELDTNGVTTPGTIAVRFLSTATTDQIGAALVTAINSASLGLSPAYAGNGLVTLAGAGNTILDLSNTVLTQAGQPGEPGAIRISLPVGTDTDAEDVATIIQSVINAQNLPGITISRFGGSIIIEGALGIAGVGAGRIESIKDLAGNSLKPNQADGSTSITVFMGEGFDFGDAPSPYLSTSAENGPRHSVVPGLSLGATVTADADARLPNADDDDGLVFTSPILAAFQTNATISVQNTTGSNAYISLWVDYNGDGFFANTERIINAALVSQPTVPVSFLVPSSAVAGSTYARIRLSTDAASIATSLGESPDGEVEDYAITISATPYQNPNNRLDVSNDTFVSPIDVLQVVNYLNSGAPSELTLPATNVPPYLDVNGDGFVTPIDVLLIVNYLNALPPSGEGEANDVGDSQPSGLYSSQSTVLSSDWAVGLDSLLLQPKLTGAVTHATDAALLDAEGEEDLALASASDNISAIDCVWAVPEDLEPAERSEELELDGKLVDELLS
ncbi:MAG: pre-peptidase C-terminal domain-containing protein [Planctomycetales bacterium]|nr:pre-peptidase C-terminal domain-containing protein [Planctomycetales bacterium]